MIGIVGYGGDYEVTEEGLDRDRKKEMRKEGRNRKEKVIVWFPK